MNILITIITALYVLFLPGFMLSLLFFRWRKIDIIERVLLSFGLSIAIIPLAVFYCNLLGIAITTTGVFIQTCIVIIIASGALAIEKWRKK